MKKFGLENAKCVKTPMNTNDKLSKDENHVSIDPTLFTSMIGSLLYLTTSRLDIFFSFGLCARYQANPKESHIVIMKRIIRYVNGIVDYGIWSSKDTNSGLTGYNDVNWASNVDNRKSNTGRCFYLRNNLVFWYNKKQNSISLSTAKIEYIVAGSCCTQLLWMK